MHEQLASGGMGVVYRVFDRVSRQMCAMKRLISGAGSTAFAQEAFEREFHVLASLDHPRIIRVFEYGVDARGPFYTMELLEGDDMRRAAPLPYVQACLYLRDIATSLSLLHARRVIHRDLSPTNVRLTPDGHCKLLDFGALAAFGHSRVVVGTPPVIPPEALDGSPLDARADLYSLGALAYWTLTGRHAYPAREIAELRGLWRSPLVPPSAISPDVPKDLDALVMSMLSQDPLARPPSAAEVIAQLEVVADLPPEDASELRHLEQSFFANPRYTGREEELRTLQGMIEGAVHGLGGAVCIQAAAGMGRTRLLEEIGVRAQLAGATVVRADAGTYGQLHGTARALALRVFDAVPELACRTGAMFRDELMLLGPDVEAALTGGAPKGEKSAPVKPELPRPLAAWFGEISRVRPLVIQVDNAEYADDASLGLLASLARASSDYPILLTVTECSSREVTGGFGLAALRKSATAMQLDGLSAGEMLELARSMFGDAPNLERLADWLQEQSAGSPLHAIEICRQLAARGIIRYAAGLWSLPLQRPDAALPAELGEALYARVLSLSDAARSLVECLSLQHGQPTLELCRLLCGDAPELDVLTQLDELARQEVMYPDREGYRFSSTALRQAVLANMDESRREKNHKRLGEALAKLAGAGSSPLHLQAGWHLIEGGDEERGADMIAALSHDASMLRRMMSDLHRAGPPLTAALRVYASRRRSLYARMPLLSGLAQAGFCEDRGYADRYGDQALDAVEELSGLGTARRLRRFLGGWLSLIAGVTFAFVRFVVTPKAERPYGFDKILIHLFTTVAALTGLAGLSLDAKKAGHIADTLKPFDVLPDRLTPSGIYLYCRTLEEIGRENEAYAYDRFDALIRRLEDPKYYPALPLENRTYLLAGAHFARGSFAIFRAHGQAALESADALDATGMKLYAMIASQLRYLYYCMRAEFTKAEPHRDQVELHAAHVGSVWQVETWEASALLLVYAATLSDIVNFTRLAHRIEAMSRDVPSLKHYSRIAKHVLMLARQESSVTEEIAAVYDAFPPRSYIGWAPNLGALARVYNLEGRHAEAKTVCERVLAHVTDADREYVSLFSIPDIEMAIAEAGLGQHQAGLERIDALLTRFADADHPLNHGLLHDARARICWDAGRKDEYAKSLREVERSFRAAGMPALIARWERLAQLGSPGGVMRALHDHPDRNTTHSRDVGPSDDVPTQVVVASDLGAKSRTRSV